MKGERWRRDHDVLRDCWGRWTAILALFARGRPARHRLDPRAYADLRKELIAACRSLAAADDPERLYYTGLEETVKPWLNLSAIGRTDREILSGLLLYCRKVEGELNGRKSRLALPLPGKLALATVTGGAVIGGLVWLLPMAGLAVLESLQNAANTIWLTFKYADSLQKGTAIAVIVVLTSMYVVSRSARE